MNDITNTAPVKITQSPSYNAHLRKLLGEMLQVLHDDRDRETPFRRRLEIKILGEMFDCYVREDNRIAAAHVKDMRDYLAEQDLRLSKKVAA